MSRIGKKPIPIPAGVQVEYKDNSLFVKGPKGAMSQKIHPDINVEVDEKSKLIHVRIPSENKLHKALFGLNRTLMANAVYGVSQGYEKRLDIVGVGYNAKLKGNNLELQIGFTHPATLPIPDGIAIDLPVNTKIVVRGADKHMVGQFAANIRKIRPPEPYKGKGIKYESETIRRKVGKSFVGGAG